MRAPKQQYDYYYWPARNWARTRTRLEAGAEEQAQGKREKGGGGGDRREPVPACVRICISSMIVLGINGNL